MELICPYMCVEIHSTAYLKGSTVRNVYSISTNRREKKKGQAMGEGLHGE